MSEPSRKHKEPLRGAAFEIHSGLSALNMGPDPIPLDEQEPDNNGYLSQTDAWVQHAYEHFRAALDCINQEENSASFTSVKLLKEMLLSGQITDRAVVNFLLVVQDEVTDTPGYLRDLHQKAKRFKWEMENE